MRPFPFAAALLLWPLAGLAQPRAAGGPCREACERYVKVPKSRTQVCGRCTLGELDRGAWVLSLAEQQPSASALTEVLGDEDWAVRWGAVRALAGGRGVHPSRQLATWVVEARGGAALLACETALHAAGQARESTNAFFAKGGAMGPSAAALCWQKKDALRAKVEKALYAQAGFERREALRHLAAFLSISPSRVALDTLRDRPPQGDAIIAQLLYEEAASGGPPVGRALLSEVKRDEGPLADRLLAHWAPKVDAERQNLKSPDDNVRRAAVTELSALGPLGDRELEAALGDGSVRVALAAARGLARGEGLTVTAMVRKQLAPASTASEATRLKWLELLGKSQEKECAALLAGLVGDPKVSERLRGAGAVAWAACAGAEALPGLRPLLGASSAELRAGAVEALGELPRAHAAPELVAAALKDPEPLVQAAAARAAGALRLTQRVPALISLLEQGGAPVRQAAAQALKLMPAPQAAAPLARVLKQDPDVAVRLSCVAALAELGGPEALAALTHATRQDGEEKVKVAAAAALRRLGFEPASGALRQ